MPTSAHIQIFANTDTAKHLSSALRDLDCELIPATSLETALGNLASQICELAIIADNDFTDQVAYMEALSKSRNHTVFEHIPMPIIVIDGDAKAFKRGNALIDFVPQDFTDDELASKVRSLARLSSVQGEFVRRSQSADDFSITPFDPIYPPDRIHDCTVLFVTGDIGDNTVIETAFLDLAPTTSISDPFDAVAALEGNTFDAVVVSLGDDEDPDEKLWMCSAIRANPQLFNLPIIMISAETSFENTATAFENGVSELIIRPVTSAQLHRHGSSVLRRQLYRRQILEACRATFQENTRDETTGLHNLEFVTNHFQRLMTFAVERNKHLSIAKLNIVQLDENAAKGEQSKFLRHVGHMTSRLIRGEDTAGRVDPNSIMIAMPDTPIDAARHVLHRLVAIIENTEYEPSQSEEMAAFTLRHSIVEPQSVENIQSLINRMDDNLLV
jgi:PleD family two-component response regulator